jgi:hypothetical protein
MEKAMIEGAHGKQSFIVLAGQVFGMSPEIEWVVLEEAGCEPRWAWRDPETGKLCLATTTNNAQLIDPLLFMLAERSDGASEEETTANPHRLLFVVLAYADITQLVARMGADAHISVGVLSPIDAHCLGTKLASLLDTYVHRPVMQ